MTDRKTQKIILISANDNKNIIMTASEVFKLGVKNISQKIRNATKLEYKGKFYYLDYLFEGFDD